MVRTWSGSLSRAVVHSHSALMLEEGIKLDVRGEVRSVSPIAMK